MLNRYWSIILSFLFCFHFYANNLVAHTSFSQSEISVAQIKFKDEPVKIIDPECSDKLSIPKVPMGSQLSSQDHLFIRDFTPSLYRGGTNIGLRFIEKIPSPKLSKQSTEYQYLLKNEACYQLLIDQSIFSNNQSHRSFQIWRHYYSVNYPKLIDKDIFPLPGALYLFRKKQLYDSDRKPDAYMIPKKDYPAGIHVGYGTLIYPLIPRKNNEGIEPYSIVKEIKLDKNNELQVKLTYSPQTVYGTYKNPVKAARNSSNQASYPMVTKWFKKGDIVPYYRANACFRIYDYATVDLAISSWWYELVKGENYALQITNIVPRDPYPIRDVNGTKGRLIGWIEFDAHPILINSEGKPLTAEQMKNIGQYEYLKPRSETFRNWTDKNGKIIAHAKCKNASLGIPDYKKPEINIPIVRLTTEDQKTIEFPIEDLSEEDKKYIHLDQLQLY
ncbi:MAG: hypothetical protein LBT09_07410 [Planctomycetaceae bacterium]|jgi:hypothetical protein|nr:hypothetical protein [Planctomycetaceae bacterium]